MNNFKFVSVVLALVLSTSTNAALISRLDGAAYYDTTLDITWLADVNYAQTSGFDADGKMQWEAANSWATTLSINGITGWRLPTLSPVNGVAYNKELSTNGSSDRGYGETSLDPWRTGGWRDDAGTPVSELGHMYYVNLNGLGGCSPSFEWCTLQDNWGVGHTGPFSNLNPAIDALSLYWTDTYYDHDEVWYLSSQGRQSGLREDFEAYAWVVHDGDVARLSSVPVPAAFWLFGSGLMTLTGYARQKTNRSRTNNL